jgi:hypothetical protein
VASKIRKYCPNCRQTSWHENRVQDGKESCVCLLCELLEQQLREPGEDKFQRNTSSSTHPKDVYEFLRSWGGPFGGGLAGG